MKTLLSTAVVVALSCNFASAAPNPHHAPPFEKLLTEFDVNQDGTLTQDEVQLKLGESFKTADMNADGFLTTDELEVAHEQKREVHLAEKFAELDQNSDGGISADELTTVSGPDRHLARHFTEIDSNGDGLITLDEMRTSMQAHEAEMADRHQQMQHQKLSRLDNDGDGLISLAEFTANLPMFDHLDANEDGVITADEAANQQPPMDGPQHGHKQGNGQRPAHP